MDQSIEWDPDFRLVLKIDTILVPFNVFDLIFYAHI